MKLGNGFWLETLTHELYEEWEIGFEILEDEDLILRSFSGRSNLKKRWFLRSQARNPITVGYQDKSGKLTSFRRWCQSYLGLITTRRTANEPRGLGDQSRRTGWICSRITSRVVDRLWSNWCFRRFMTKVNEEEIAHTRDCKTSWQAELE